MSGRAKRVHTDWHNGLTCACVLYLWLELLLQLLMLFGLWYLRSCLCTRPRVHVRARACEISQRLGDGIAQKWQTLSSPVRPRDVHTSLPASARRHTQAHARTHTDTLLTPTRSQCVLFTHPVPLCPLSHTLPSVPVLKHPQRTIIFSHCGRTCLCWEIPLVKPFTFTVPP